MNNAAADAVRENAQRDLGRETQRVKLRFATKLAEFHGRVSRAISMKNRNARLTPPWHSDDVAALAAVDSGQ